MIAYRDASRFETLPAHMEELRRVIGAPDPLAALQCLDELQAMPLPPSYLVRSPEGYVHYALDPVAYGDSARCYAREAGAERAREAVVVGLRTIGTSLSAVVAATLGAERTITVRPRGESGARRVLTGERLLRRLRHWLADDPDVLVVDEGPGATGETFLRAWEWLRELGVPRDRIVFLPSHEGGFSMAPADRRTWFDTVRRYAPPLYDARPERLAARFGLSDLHDLSGGRWRGAVDGAAAEAARASYERVKLAARDSLGRAVVLRYAGAGRWGARADARARTLAELGLTPAVLGTGEGFRLQEWAPGRVLRPVSANKVVVRAASEYVVARAPLFATGRPVPFEGFVRLLEENATEALRDGRIPGVTPADVARARAGLGGAVLRLLALPDRQAVVADARLHLREWVVGPDGVMKVDAADDGDGLRWPGPTDLAWDIAGIAIEFRLPDAAVAELIERCARAAGENATELAAALRAYRPVYAAAALGDAVLSAREAFTTADRWRLEAEAARYTVALVRELAA